MAGLPVSRGFGFLDVVALPAGRGCQGLAGPAGLAAALRALMGYPGSAVAQVLMDLLAAVGFRGWMGLPAEDYLLLQALDSLGSEIVVRFS